MKINFRHRRYGCMPLTSALIFANLATTAPVEASAPAKNRPALLLAGSVRLSGIYCTASTNCVAVGLKASKGNALLN